MKKVLDKPQGLLLVVSGPSGAGKGTICSLLRQALPELSYSVSVTTRAPREGEVDGKDYFFKTVAQVKDMIFRGELLEYAQVYGNYYGTPKPYVMELLNNGKDVLLEIDIQGALQIKKVFPDGVFIFVIPPSLEELRARIYKRGTDAEEVIEKRLKAATSELSYASEYDYIIVNDVAEKATQRVLTLLEAERYRAGRTYFLVDKMLQQHILITGGNKK
jgi:guanylate kinase